MYLLIEFYSCSSLDCLEERHSRLKITAMKTFPLIISFIFLAFGGLVNSKVVPRLPKIPNLPPVKIPKIPKISKIKWETINQFLPSGDKAANLWNHFESLMDFFDKIKNIIAKDNEDPAELEKKWKSYEFVHCYPDDPKETC